MSNQGAAVPSEAIFEVTKSCSFDAAHQLAEGTDQPAYARLHGHSFKVDVTVRGPAKAPIGWVEDLGELDAAVKVICAELDHSLLNSHKGLESPTLEALCLFFADRLSGAFPGLARVTVSRPTVGERCALNIEQ